jgi:hypothetical protein
LIRFLLINTLVLPYLVDETISLSTRIPDENAVNETLNVKKWHGFQVHTAVMRVQRDAGIYLSNSLLNNLAACTAIYEGLRQPRSRLSVSHQGKRAVRMYTVQTPYIFLLSLFWRKNCHVKIICTLIRIFSPKKRRPVK